MEAEKRYIPLDGGERIRIMIYFLLMAATSAFFGLGALPFLIVLVSLYIINKDKNYKFLKSSRIIVKVLFIVLGVSVILFGLYHGVGYRNDSFYLHQVGGIIFTAASIPFFVASSDYFFYDVMFKHEDWIIHNGLFADTENEKSSLSKVSDKISKVSPGRTLTTADAILQYKKLLDEGLITKEQFNKKRDELFN